MSARQIDPSTISWLRDQGSLTRRLVGLCGNAFSVRVLSQRWVTPLFEEAQLLRCSPKQKVLLRQVQLLCGRKVLVYARSIIPLDTLRGKHRRLKYLGDKPLGGYLFANPQVQREQQHWASVVPGDPLFDIVLSCSRGDCESIWGRRSLFRIDGKPLLVSEYFLPELLRQ